MMKFYWWTKLTKIRLSANVADFFQKLHLTVDSFDFKLDDCEFIKNIALHNRALGDLNE